MSEYGPQDELFPWDLSQYVWDDDPVEDDEEDR